jgi:hypothetical protein
MIPGWPFSIQCPKSHGIFENVDQLLRILREFGGSENRGPRLPGGLKI